MNLFTGEKITKSIFAYILWMISGAIGVFIGSILGLSGMSITTFFTADLGSLLLGMGMAIILSLILSITVFWWLHNQFIGKITIIQIIIIVIGMAIFGSILLAVLLLVFSNFLGSSLIVVIANFLAFHILYHVARGG